MQRAFSSLFIASLIIITDFNVACSQNQHSDSAKRYEFTYATASPKAQSLMKEAFFWSPIEESGPFGSDDGSDAAYGFCQWRISNKNTDPMVYLKDLITQWNYPYFDWTVLDTNKIKIYIEKGTVKGMGRYYLLGLDNAIIGTGFAQLVLEGHISNDIKNLTTVAIKRELLPLLINKYNGKYQNIKKDQLSKMMVAIMDSD